MAISITGVVGTRYMENQCSLKELPAETAALHEAERYVMQDSRKFSLSLGVNYGILLISAIINT